MSPELIAFFIIMLTGVLSTFTAYFSNQQKDREARVHFEKGMEEVRRETERIKAIMDSDFLSYNPAIAPVAEDHYKRFSGWESLVSQASSYKMWAERHGDHGLVAAYQGLMEQAASLRDSEAPGKVDQLDPREENVYSSPENRIKQLMAKNLLTRQEIVELENLVRQEYNLG